MYDTTYLFTSVVFTNYVRCLYNNATPFAGDHNHLGFYCIYYIQDSHVCI